MAPRLGAGSKISPLLAAKSPRVAPSALGSGRAGLKRHAKRRAPDGSAALSRPALRRLARRGGVKRIGAGIYEAVPALARAWIGKIVRDAVVFTEHGRRKTVTTNDVVMALKRNGITLYGYAAEERRRCLFRPLRRETLAAARAAAAPASQAAAQVDLARASAQPATPAAHAAAAAPADLERCRDIEAAAMEFVYGHSRFGASGAGAPALTAVLLGVNARLSGAGRTAVGAAELEGVLRLMEGEGKVMLAPHDTLPGQTAVFLCF